MAHSQIRSPGLGQSDQSAMKITLRSVCLFPFVHPPGLGTGRCDSVVTRIEDRGPAVLSLKSFGPKQLCPITVPSDRDARQIRVSHAFLKLAQNKIERPILGGAEDIME